MLPVLALLALLFFAARLLHDAQGCLRAAAGSVGLSPLVRSRREDLTKQHRWRCAGRRSATADFYLAEAQLSHKFRTACSTHANCKSVDFFFCCVVAFRYHHLRAGAVHRRRSIHRISCWKMESWIHGKCTYGWLLHQRKMQRAWTGCIFLQRFSHPGT